MQFAVLALLMLCGGYAFYALWRMIENKEPLDRVTGAISITMMMLMIYIIITSYQRWS